MAQLLEKVQRGDIITADMWNLMVDAVNGLLQAGQTSGIQITGLTPAGTSDAPLRIGTLVQVLGRSFGFSVGQSRITFEGDFGTVAVPFSQLLLGSSDSRLAFLMPALPGATAAGITATLRVNNGVADDVRSVVVMPVVINLQGSIIVNWRSDMPSGATNPSPNPITAGQSATFAYTLRSAINMPASFTLSADIVNASTPVPVGLVSSIQFLNEAPLSGGGMGPGSEITDKTVQLGKDETRNIYVRIPQVPVSFAGATFQLRVTAGAGGLIGADARTFTENAGVAQPDPNIIISQLSQYVADAETGNPNSSLGQIVGSSIQLRPHGKAILQFEVTFLQPGTVDVSLGPRAGATLSGWSFDLQDLPTNPMSIPVTANQTIPLSFGVATSDGATATGGIVYRIKRQSATGEQTKEYNVQLLPAG